MDDEGFHIACVEPCGCCGAASYFVRCLDRWIHCDGSANAECWASLSRGETICLAGKG